MSRARHLVFLPVLCGGASSFIGDVLMAFSDFQYVVKYFFTIFMIMIAISLFNALVVLPSLLAIIGSDKEPEAKTESTSTTSNVPAGSAKTVAPQSQVTTDAMVEASNASVEASVKEPSKVEASVKKPSASALALGAPVDLPVSPSNEMGGLPKKTSKLSFSIDTDPPKKYEGGGGGGFKIDASGAKDEQAAKAVAGDDDAFNQSTISGRLDSVIEARLLDSVARARRRRVRVSGGSFGIAFFTFLCGLVFMVLADGIWWHIGATLVGLSAPFFVMTMMPTDAFSIYTISSGVCIASGVACIMILVNDVVPQFDNLDHANCTFTPEAKVVCSESMFGVSTALCAVLGLLFLMLLSGLLPKRTRGKWGFRATPRSVLALLWQAILIGAGVQGTFRIVSAIIRITSRPEAVEDMPIYPNIFDTGEVAGLFLAGVTFLLVAVIAVPAVHRRVQQLIAGTGIAAQSASSAAGVASLVGGIDTRDALSIAICTFRAVIYSRLEPIDILDNSPNPALEAKKLLGDINFLEKLQDYDKDNMPKRYIRKIIKEQRSPSRTEPGDDPAREFDRADQLKQLLAAYEAELEPNGIDVDDTTAATPPGAPTTPSPAPLLLRRLLLLLLRLSM